MPQLRRIFGQQRNGAIRRAWFIQDGAPAHRRILVRNRLQELFPNRVIALGHPVEWPPRSPDLTPLDFWLWGDVKAKVYSQGPPGTLLELRRRIEGAFRAIRRTRVTQRAVQNMREGHFNALLNKESKLKTEIKGKEISNRGQTVFSHTIFNVLYLFIQLRYTYLFFRVDN